MRNLNKIQTEIAIYRKINICIKWENYKPWKRVQTY